MSTVEEAPAALKATKSSEFAGLSTVFSWSLRLTLRLSWTTSKDSFNGKLESRSRFARSCRNCRSKCSIWSNYCQGQPQQYQHLLRQAQLLPSAVLAAGKALPRFRLAASPLTFPLALSSPEVQSTEKRVNVTFWPAQLHDRGCLLVECELHRLKEHNTYEQFLPFSGQHTVDVNLSQDGCSFRYEIAAPARIYLFRTRRRGIFMQICSDMGYQVIRRYRFALKLPFEVSALQLSSQFVLTWLLCDIGYLKQLSLP
eukprot:6213767-Pleurochrysis_carterae.AAC.5